MYQHKFVDNENSIDIYIYIYIYESKLKTTFQPYISIILKLRGPICQPSSRRNDESKNSTLYITNR